LHARDATRSDVAADGGLEPAEVAPRDVGPHGELPTLHRACGIRSTSCARHVGPYRELQASEAAADEVGPHAPLCAAELRAGEDAPDGELCAANVFVDPVEPEPPLDATDPRGTADDEVEREVVLDFAVARRRVEAEWSEQWEWHGDAVIGRVVVTRRELLGWERAQVRRREVRGAAVLEDRAAPRE